MNDDDRISHYLDDLMSRLRGSPSSVRRIINETEAHLRDAVDDGVARGRSLSEAENEALANFGSAREIARASNNEARSGTFRVVLSDVTSSTWILSTAGLLAIGASGLLIRIAQSLFGIGAVFGPTTGTHFSDSSCRYWMSIHPAAQDCLRAYTVESSQDGMLARTAAGLMGLILLAIGMLLHRRGALSMRGGRAWLISAVGFTSFAAAGVILTGFGVDQLVVGSDNGAWQWLCEGCIALIAAACFGVKLLGLLRDSAINLEARPTPAHH